MRRLRQRFSISYGVVGTTIVLALAAGGTAVAGGGKSGGEVSAAGGQTSTSAGGYRYVTKFALNPPSSQDNAAANCPNGEPLVSGGVYSQGGFGTHHVNSMIPQDGGDPNNARDNRFRVYMDNLSSNSMGFTVYAVCDRAPPSRYRYVVQSPRVLAPAGQVTVADADCPSDEPVVGGGVASGGPWGATHLVDHGPRPPTRNDFVAGVDNISSQGRYIAAYAICDKRPGLGYRYPDDYEHNPGTPGTQSKGDVDCPNGEPLVGGGGGGEYNNRPAHLNSSRPSDDGDANSAPDDGWEAWADVPGPDNSGVSTRAVCKK